MEKLTAHNLAQQTKAEKRRKKIRAARETGKTWKQIGEQFGVTRQRAQQLGSAKP